jgi:hypothetical protein
MKKTAILLLIAFSLYSHCARSQDSRFEWLDKWLRAWELVSKELFALPDTEPPEMVFYDDTFVYTTSAKTAPDGVPFTGPALYGKKQTWRKMPHKDSLMLPDGRRVPVALMSFAGATRDGGSFFVMAAPAFWKTAGIESKELTLDKMLVGVFLHEFAHTRQYDGFGKMIDKVEQNNTFPDIPLNDDIVQGYFRKDTAYTRIFLEETEAFYIADTASKKLAKASARKALALLKSRQKKYFTGDKAILTRLDDIFLSMEGLGQYAAIYWLTHPKGGNINREIAINGFRRNRNQWSQEEGLAMFLTLTRFAKPDWLRDQFGQQPKTIVALLETALRE